jgi:plasmid maintenance system antidote protein VapI
MDEDDASLNDEERERIWYLDELVEDGYYDPFRIDQTDIAELMHLNGIVSEDVAYANDFTEEDEKRLAKVLETDWESR